MRNREEAEKRRAAKCRHFNGVQNERCESKITYPSNYEVCFGQVADFECVGYNPLNAEELAAKKLEQDRHMDLMRRGLSVCCEAPFDNSHVITEGEHKNHGPRFCSKCKRLCFMV